MTGTNGSGRNWLEQGNDRDEYFYANGQRVTLQRRNALVAVIFDTRAPISKIEDTRCAAANLELTDEFGEIQGSNLRLYRVTDGSMDARSAARVLAAAPGVQKVGTLYTNHHQQPLVSTDEIVCKFNAGRLAEDVEAIKAQFGLETALSLSFSDNAYVLHTTTGAEQSLVRIANTLVEQGYAEYAYPNFIEHIGYHITAAAVEPAIASGEECHAVLPDDPQFGQHQRAAVESEPNCRLTPIKVGDTTSQVLTAVGLASAADRGADVILCSLEPVGAWIMTDALREAIQYATTYGRNGRGCVYFQTEIDLCEPSNYLSAISTTNSSSPCCRPEAFGTANAILPAADVACLVLSVNPALSWNEVRQVLLDSTTRIDAAASPHATAAANRSPVIRADHDGYARVNVAHAVRCASAPTTHDLYIRDTLLDLGTAPHANYGFWDSPDIWVRNTDDGGSAHQDTVRGRDNWIHARVSNRGTQDALPCWVRFFITSYIGTQFRYPFDFKRDLTGTFGGGTPGNLRPAAQFPAPGSYLIGEQRITSVPAGGSAIAKVRWNAALIPSATNWHPCLLVEVSPHDGPMPTGPYVWENNNLAQKNITIINARRGELLQLPFRFGHATLADAFLTLSFNKLDPRSDWKLFLDMQDTHLVEAIATGADVKLPAGRLSPDNPFILNASITPGRLLNLYQAKLSERADSMAAIQPATGNQSFGVTFLEDEWINRACAGWHSGSFRLMFGFGGGAALEAGTQRDGNHSMPYSISEALPDPGNLLASTRGPRQLPKPAFSVEMLAGAQVLALDPSLQVAEVVVPTTKGGVHDALLWVQVPGSAQAGETLFLDVAQTDTKCQLVGGVRLQVNVID